VGVTVQDQAAEPQPLNLCTSAKLGYGWGRKQALKVACDESDGNESGGV